MFNPKKYWNVNNVAPEYLLDFVRLCNFDTQTKYSDSEVIETCIKVVREQPLTSSKKQALKDSILLGQEQMFTFFAKELCKTLEPGKEIQLVSLGCGNRSFFEEVVTKEIDKTFPNTLVRWLGLDVGDYRDKDSFFQDKVFKIIPTQTDSYFDYVDDKNIRTALVGVYSFHHIGIEFTDFLKRCTGFDTIYLVEEPTTTDLWSQDDYRIMRIALDVLANTVFVLDWAEAFMDDPSLFKINYIKENLLPENLKVIYTPNRIPETALVTVLSN